MQDMFVPRLIEIGQIFHFERFFQIYKCKNTFPLVSPNLTLSDYNLYKLKSALRQKAFM
jgi:hypothetical protein